MQRNYFGSKARIIEIDLNPISKELQSYGFEIYIGIQSHHKFWKKFYSKVCKQIFLDNEVILNPQQIKTIHFAFENNNEDGLVVFEDTYTIFMRK